MSYRFYAVLVLAASGLCAQSPEFEVASIKPAPPILNQVSSGKMHIGMTVDGARVDIGSLSLADLLPAAFRVKSYQISGPDWMSANRFDIMATIPQGVAKDKTPEMLQALLAERFKMTYHRETKDHSVYALVPGKDGFKMKPAEPDAPGTPVADTAAAGLGGFMLGSPGQARPSVQTSGGGRGMVINTPQSGATKMSMGPDGNMHLEAAKVSMAGLAEILSRFVDKPVIDMTGLEGNYQISLDLTMADLMKVAQASGMMPAGMAAGLMPGGRGGPGAPDTASEPAGAAIFSSVQKLGLKLDSRKAPIDTIVIDHLEKMPTEN